MDYDENAGRVGLSRARWVGGFLEVGGVLLALLVLVWSFHRFYEISQAAEPSTGEFLMTSVVLLGGLSAGIVLWALAEMVRRVEAAQRLLENLPPAHFGQRYAGEAPTAESGHSADTYAAAPGGWEEVTLLLRELRDISLLNDEQRSLRMQEQGKELAARLEQEVPQLMREHNWVDARRRLQEAKIRFPTFPQWDTLLASVERGRAQVEARDIEIVARQVKDLAALGAWERVADAVGDLVARHPGSTKVEELARQVHAERDRAEAEQRARLMHQAQDATNEKDYPTALAVANSLIQKYPHSAEAQALREQLPILRENAEIVARKRLESDFQDLIKEHRYGDALRLAYHVIDSYPNSVQAERLRSQLPRLEERAAATG